MAAGCAPQYGQFTSSQFSPPAGGGAIESGSFSIVAQAIAGFATYTHTVVLSRADYAYGKLMLMVPNAVLSPTPRRRVCLIDFATLNANGYSRASAQVNTDVPGYPSGTLYTVPDWRHQGYRFTSDAKLSDAFFATVGDAIRVKSCRIVGASLEVIFENTIALARLLTIDGDWRVWT
jgi:hypothetical protein